MTPQLVGYVGPGHARHAITDGETLCGAVAAVAKRTGQRPFINHTDPYRSDLVTCARCNRKLDARPPHERDEEDS